LDLKTLAESVPDYVTNKGFILSKCPVAGEWFIYSDNGMGMGRQHIASIPTDKHYFGALPQFMAAAHPHAILELYARIEAAEAGMEVAIAEAEKRGRNAGYHEAREKAIRAAWATVENQSDHSVRRGAYSTAQAVATT
jgi:hypothetical protein